MNQRLDLIKQKNARVASIDLSGREKSPWHFHSHIVENIICLVGDINVQFRKPKPEVNLKPGQRLEIKPGDEHRLVNPGSSGATYLLVQNGQYDFVHTEA